MMTLGFLAPLLNAQLIGEDKTISGVSTDSRALAKGDIFLALRGDRFDGHDFLSQAIANGAEAVVVDSAQTDLAVPQLVVNDTCLALGQIAAQNRQQFSGTVIAVTGSSGKTSVKGMLREILAVAFDVTVTPGNFNNQIGVPLSLMRLAGQDRAVIELGTNHPGEIGYLTDLVQPDIALVNNIMPAHIGGFGSLAAIAEEKSAIYKNLQQQQWAVINIDDQFCSFFESKTQACRRLGFGISGAVKGYPTLTAKNIRSEGDFAVAFDIMFDKHSVEVRLPVPGTHSVRNALAASACAIAAGCTLEQIAQGLANFTGEAGRMQSKTGVHEAHVIDDTYNANPGSVQAAIDFLASREGQRILVLGDLGELGDTAEQAHRDLGAYARQQQLDAVYACGQFAQHTAAGFGAGGVACKTKQEVIDALEHVLDKHTTVLVKGSRSARMEDVVRAITAVGGPAAC